jgi:hypothetical protein
MEIKYCLNHSKIRNKKERMANGNYPIGVVELNNTWWPYEHKLPRISLLNTNNLRKLPSIFSYKIIVCHGRGSHFGNR